MKVTPTGAIFYGVCEVTTPRCVASEGGAVTAVMSPTQGQINVCKTCLDYQISQRVWHIEGAKVSEMRPRLDVAAVDATGNVILAVEVKIHKQPSRVWALGIATEFVSHKYLSNIPFFMLGTPKQCFIWDLSTRLVSEENLTEIDATSHLFRVASRMGISLDAFTINSTTAHRTSPNTNAKQHMILERLFKNLLADENFIRELPTKVFKKIQNAEIRMEYTI